MRNLHSQQTSALISQNVTISSVELQRVQVRTNAYLEHLSPWVLHREFLVAPSLACAGLTQELTLSYDPRGVHFSMALLSRRACGPGQPSQVMFGLIGQEWPVTRLITATPYQVMVAQRGSAQHAAHDWESSHRAGGGRGGRHSGCCWRGLSRGQPANRDAFLIAVTGSEAPPPSSSPVSDSPAVKTGGEMFVYFVYTWDGDGGRFTGGSVFLTLPRPWSTKAMGSATDEDKLKDWVSPPSCPQTSRLTQGSKDALKPDTSGRLWLRVSTEPGVFRSDGAGLCCSLPFL